MALRDDLDSIKKFIQENSELIVHNRDIFEAYEGDLRKFIIKELRKQLSPESFEIAVHRIAPINLLVKLVDKLSQIYAKPPTRTIEDGGEKDKELLSFYETETRMNHNMNIVNELFNLHKTTTIEPFLEDGNPRLRGVPSDRSMWYSNNLLNPISGTHWIKWMGEIQHQGKKLDILFIYTDEEFLIVDSEMRVLQDLMVDKQNPSGINPVQQIPGIFINRSAFNIAPPADSDLFAMVKLIPIMLSDLNFAQMMQAFSIIYGIDIDVENVTFAPNVLWDVKSRQTGDPKPEVGQIKPQVDIQASISNIATQLQLWLQSRNVRPGSVGTMNAENASSGISKIVDESDTSEDRQKQVEFFKDAESKYWDLITKKLHPFWRDNKLIDTNLDWTPGVKIKTEFQEQIPLVKKREIVDDEIKQLKEKLTTRKRAIKHINPDMSDDQIIQLLDEIDDEGTEVINVGGTDPKNIDDENEMTGNNDSNIDQQQPGNETSNKKETGTDGDKVAEGSGRDT